MFEVQLQTSCSATTQRKKILLLLILQQKAASPQKFISCFTDPLRAKSEDGAVGESAAGTQLLHPSLRPPNSAKTSSALLGRHRLHRRISYTAQDTPSEGLSLSTNAEEDPPPFLPMLRMYRWGEYLYRGTNPLLSAWLYSSQSEMLSLQCK